MNNIPLSSICSTSVMYLRNITKCGSLYSISTKPRPISVFSDGSYCYPFRYGCRSYYGLSRYRENIIGDLDIHTDEYH